MRRTAKFVAAKKLARQVGASTAGNHESLYGRLRAAGYEWDPKLGRDGGWFDLKHEDHKRGRKQRARHTHRPANVLADRDPLRLLQDRVDGLEARLTETTKILLELTRRVVDPGGTVKQVTVKQVGGGK